MSDSGPALDANGDDSRLIESEQRYRSFIEMSSDLIQSVRPDCSFEFVNQAWLDKLGYTREEVADLTIWDIVHPDSLEHCSIMFQQALNGENVQDVQAVFRTKDGRRLPVEGDATSRILDGKVIATHSFFRDVTERLRSEELDARNQQLERERLARYLEKMAALGKLSAGLAHELNNPAAAAQRAGSQLTQSAQQIDAALSELHSRGLTTEQWAAIETLRDAGRRQVAKERRPTELSRLEGEVEDWLADHEIAEGWNLAATLVQEGIDAAALDELAGRIPAPALKPALVWFSESSATRELADVVSRSSQRISDLVAAVKAYSFMDRAAEQVVDVHDGIENTLIILGHQLRGLTVKREYDRSLAPVKAFGSGLNQVWTNIIDNAADAVGDGGTITIRTRGEPGKVIVEIEDNGPGIPEEHLSRVFEPFFSTKPQGEGTGLGLDVVWRIVTEEHGGTVEVESKPGRTLFRVTLQVATA